MKDKKITALICLVAILYILFGYSFWQISKLQRTVNMMYGAIVTHKDAILKLQEYAKHNPNESVGTIMREDSFSKQQRERTEDRR